MDSSKKTQTRLLERREFTYEEALQIATTMELSEQGAASLQNGGTTNPAAAVEYLQADKKPLKKAKDKYNNYNDSFRKKSAINNSYKPNSSNIGNSNPSKGNIKTVKCFRCGRGHYASRCTLSREIRCSGCGGLGHLVRVCFKKKETANQLNEVLQLEHTDRRDKFFAYSQ